MSPQVLSLPSGPGSIAGLGESFAPQLNTGTAAYQVSLLLPPGRNDQQPTLALVYEGGKGNGPFGIGWDFPLPFIQRQTDKGVPRYVDADDGIDNDHDEVTDEPDERDVFIYSHGEALVPLESGDYRFENEGGFVRFRRDGEGWIATQPDGMVLRFGMTGAGRIQFEEHIFRWYLQESRDTNGNNILYTYARYPDSPGMVYLTEIRYAVSDAETTTFHAVVFDYEARQDRFSDFRSTFEVTTGRRCKTITILTQGAPLPKGQRGDHNHDGIEDALIRRYDLTYKNNADFSLLSQITQVAADGVNYLPPITFDYTVFAPGEGTVVSMADPPPYSFADGNSDLYDADADGLPDLLHTAGSSHFYYKNMGNGRWDPERIEMGNGPASSILLASAGTHLADVNGDGTGDLVAKVGVQSFRYYLGTGQGSYEDAQPLTFLGEIPTFPFDGNDNVRLVDINFDKKIDLMLTTSSQYVYWYNLGEGRFSAPISGPVALINPFFAFRFSDSRARLGDMNGDRLQDLILVQSGNLCYFPNLGNGQWGDKVEMIASPVVGFQDQLLLLDDLNGDGLSDLILEQTGRAGEIDYWINLGNNSFSERRTIRGLPGIISNTTIRVADMNGNGTADIVWSSPFADADLKYRYLDLSAGGPPNLLGSIENGLGRRITIAYRASTAYYIEAQEAGMPWKQRLPFPVSVISTVTVTTGLDLDGVPGKDTYITDYVYRDGYYDGVEKAFRGFAQVEKREHGDTTAPTLVTRYFFHTGGPDGMDNDNNGMVDEREPDGSREEEPLKGSLLQIENFTDTGTLFSRAMHSWSIRELLRGTDVRRVRFAHLLEKKTEIFEGGDSPVILRQRFAYDDYGNVIAEKNEGALSLTGDELSTYTEFIHNTEHWILHKPRRQYMTDASGTIVSETRNYYDGAAYVGLGLGEVDKGNLTRQEGWVAGDIYINLIRNAYDAFGNIVGIMDGNGNLREIVYDPAFHTLPIREIIHVGGGKSPLAINADYDFGFGVMTQSTDVNGHATLYDYDSFGRLVKIVKPGDSLAFPTLSFRYTLADPDKGLSYHYDANGHLSLTSLSSTASSITTSVREQFGASGTLDTIQYVDGLGRKLALVEEAESGFVVKNAALFNDRGTVRTTFQPYATAINAYQAPTEGDTTEVHYDALGRPIRQINPPDQDGNRTQVTTLYRPLQETVFDELGNEKTVFRDGLDRLVEVHEVNGSERYITRYAYNPLDSLIRIIDAQNNVTLMAYDGLQRKVFMDHPDRGVMSYAYDAASNLIATVDAKGQRITYTYDGANRLLTEEYHDEGQAFSANRSPDVLYHYDTPAGQLAFGDTTHGIATNTRGMLAWVQDLSGEEHLSYDARGRLLWRVKRIPDPFTGVPASYATTMSYDAMDRVTALIYPDNDRIAYTYNARGLLESMQGGPTGHILAHIDYRPSGQLQRCQYGNGVVTEYAYDPQLRLTSLVTHRGAEPGNPVLAYRYTFDGASNITAIEDQRPAAAIPLNDPRRNTQHFTYDDLYRLTGVQYPEQGTIAYSYDRIGNMVSQTSPINHRENGVSVTNLGTMAYGGVAGRGGRVGRKANEPPGPHALTSTNNGTEQRGYAYDADGNMTSLDGMRLTWDVKDRLVAIENDTVRAVYTYDYTDRRISKTVMPKPPAITTADSRAPPSPTTTLYIDQYFEVREYDQPVKYVFHGETRVAQITGTLDATAQRVQRLRVLAGWNVLSLAVQAANAAAQLGIGSNPAIQEVYRWDAATRDYVAMRAGETFPAGTVFWLLASTAATLEVRGTYVEPQHIPIAADGTFVPTPAFEAVLLDQALPPETERAWIFDATGQRWRSRFSGELAFLSDMPPFLGSGQGIYVQMPKPADLRLPDAAQRIRYYHQDHLGSSNVITDASGALVEEVVFYPFGHPRRHYEPPTQRALPNAHYLFTQKEYDQETGLYYFEARYYHPTVHNFISPDPLYAQSHVLSEEALRRLLYTPQKLNLYPYGLNNPLRYTDPSGLDEKERGFFGEVFARIMTAFTPPSAYDYARRDMPFSGASGLEALAHMDARLGLRVERAGDNGGFWAGAFAEIVSGLLSPIGHVTSAKAASAGANVTAKAARGGGVLTKFIVTRGGTAVHASQSEMIKSITRAGAVRVGPTTVTTEAGEIFRMTTSYGPMEIRVMRGKLGGGPLQGPRTIVTRPGTKDYLYPSGESIKGNLSKAERKAIGHIHGQRP